MKKNSNFTEIVSTQDDRKHINSEFRTLVEIVLIHFVSPLSLWICVLLFNKNNVNLSLTGAYYLFSYYFYILDVQSQCYHVMTNNKLGQSSKCPLRRGYLFDGLCIEVLSHADEARNVLLFRILFWNVLQMLRTFLILMLFQM